MFLDGESKGVAQFAMNEEEFHKAVQVCADRVKKAEPKKGAKSIESGSDAAAGSSRPSPISVKSDSGSDAPGSDEKVMLRSLTAMAAKLKGGPCASFSDFGDVNLSSGFGVGGGGCRDPFQEAAQRRRRVVRGKLVGGPGVAVGPRFEQLNTNKGSAVCPSIDTSHRY